MRIIAGTAKGTKLGRVPPGTRPVSDRAREGLFSSLGGAVVGTEVLDLYAGSGAVGIEALSRGAAHATFVDRSEAAVKAIRENLARTGLAGRARVLRRTAGGYLRGRPPLADLVFLDPPYATPEDELSQVIEGLTRALGRGPGGWTVALTRPSKGYTDVVPVDWRLAKRLDYGDTLISLYREV